MDTSNADTPPRAMPPLPDMAPGLRGFVSLDALARLVLWCGAFAAATAVFSALRAWPAGSPLSADPQVAWSWGWKLAMWMLVFNYAYVLELLVLRALIPTPKEGRYSIRHRVPPAAIIWSCLCAVLTKARFEPPFPGFLVFHVANLPPLSWLMNAVFGPRSKSCYVVDPRIIDPYMVTIGRNVTIGFNTTIAGHYQDRDSVVLKRTIIEDEVLVGGHTAIFGGVHIGRGAVIRAGSVLMPGTVVGPEEYWGGVPARKLREMPFPEEAPAPA